MVSSLSRPGAAGLLGLALLALALAPLRAGEGEAPIPLEDFFAAPSIGNAQLSPDGNYISYETVLEGRRGVALLDVRTGQAQPLFRAADEDVTTHFWKGNRHVVVAADIGGNESFAWQSIDVESRRVVRLYESAGDNVTAVGGAVGGLISFLPLDDEHFLAIDSSTRGYAKVHVASGRRRAVAPVVPDQLSAFFDHGPRLRLRERLRGGRIVLEAALGEGREFKTLQEREADLFTEADIRGVLADNRTAYLVDPEAGPFGALRPLDLETGEWGAPVFTPEQGEITSVVFTPDRTRLAGVTTEYEKPTTHWLDPQWAEVQRALDAALPATRNLILTPTRDGRRMIVRAASDTQPGVYFLFDLTGARPRLMPVGTVNLRLDPKRLRPMEPVWITARDGLRLQAYLTRPAGAEGRRVPLIVNPHGGPFGVRDSWGFDPEVQFLASRGYAVLRVNFRGSGGFGRAFLEKGRREWGGKMQDDLTDSVRWAIAEGIADPARVVIYGASYGGYAALAGAVHTPDLYAAAVNYVGVTDLLIFAERGPLRGFRYGRQLFLDRWVSPDREELRARSPVHFVDRIRIPTMHAYGRNDPRVDLEHWRRLERELRRHGRDYEAWIEGEEGHGFFNDEAELRFYRRLEAFLARHVPAGGS